MNYSARGGSGSSLSVPSSSAYNVVSLKIHLHISIGGMKALQWNFALYRFYSSSEVQY